MTVDKQVYGLSESYLSELSSGVVEVDEARRLELAEAIQATIDDFLIEISGRNKDLEKCRTRSA